MKKIYLLLLCICTIITAQSQDYVITTTGNHLVITDVSGNSETLEILESVSIIFFYAADRTFSLNGSSPVEMPAYVELAGILSITINTGAGNDIINIEGFTPQLPSLTINGGTGNDEVNFTGDISFAPNANLNLDLQNDDAVPGADRVELAENANLQLSGTGMATVKVSKDVLVNIGAGIVTVNGDLVVEANQQETPTPGTFAGIRMSGLLQSTGSGLVTIKGKGGNTGYPPFGVLVTDGAVISSNTSTLTVIGNAIAPGPASLGVYILKNSMINSSGGNVVVKGTHNLTVGSSSSGGVTVGGGCKVMAGGNGTVTIEGSNYNTGSGNQNVGVSLVAAEITSMGGNVDVKGTGGGTAPLGENNTNYGVRAFSSKISAGGAGAVTVVGKAGLTNGENNDGVFIYGTSSIISSGGNLSITGEAGINSLNRGINFEQGSLTCTNDADLALIANSISIAAGFSVTAGNNSVVNIIPYTNGTGINLGTITKNNSGPLSLSDAELDLVTADHLVIGDANSGTITVSADITRAAATNLKLISAGDMDFSLGGIHTGGGTLLLDPGISPAAVKPVFNGTDAEATMVSFGSDLAIAINGTTAGNGTGATFTQLTVAGAIDLSGVDLLLSGSHIPVTGQTFMIVDNDGSEDIIATFNGLAEGALIHHFLGSILSASISYSGGTGNDVVVTVLGPCASPGAIWYVNQAASLGGSGTSWACAFQNVQDAINAASSGQEVWVAAGTYLPTKDPNGNAAPADLRTRTFYLKDGVKIFGGFAGVESLREERNFMANLTILSGDFNGNDAGFTNNGENAYNVVISVLDGLETEINGFTIKGGNASLNISFAVEGISLGYNSGAGIMSNRSSLKVINCTVSGNSALIYGGGMFSRIVPSIVSNCIFSGNKAQAGGAIANDRSSGTVSNTSFSGNTTTGGGGGIFNDISSPTITNCYFTGNSAVSGAGINNFNTSSPAVTNCIFIGNESIYGSGIHNSSSSSPMILHCSFSGNKASVSFGCIYNLTTSQPVIKNSIIWGNSAAVTNQDAGSSSTITYSIVQGGYPGTGNSGSNPLFVSQPAIGLGISGDLHLQACSPAIDSATSAGAPSTDLEGNPRPANAGYDMGAYEFQGAIPAITYYTDADHDGYGTGTGQDFCSDPGTGWSLLIGDCEDNPANGGAAIHPGATEICDGRDNDCDGETDEDLVLTIWYWDADGDGFGTGIGLQFCSDPGLGYALIPGDCRDDDHSIYPGATELCDGKDNDCDGSADEGVTTGWYKDSDNDGYGETGGSLLIQCLRPVGYKMASELTANTGDCNDGNAAINPGATEVCNGKDDNCDGQTDEGVKTHWYKDADGDGYSDGTDQDACSRPEGYRMISELTSTIIDCNDADVNVNPGATEVCNGKDDNCDGQTDEGVKTHWYKDADGDGYSDGTDQDACSRPAGYRLISELTTTIIDCNDADVNVNPGATEVCNGKDDNCDGQTDEGVKTHWYKDADGDGYSDGTDQDACSRPAGYRMIGELTSTIIDCNDADVNVNPGATEVCNGKDDNCDGQTDEGVKTHWYKDADGDGYSDGTDQDACSRPAGYRMIGELTSTIIDCNDADVNVNPGATEVCNGKDDNCDGQTDEGVKTTWYTDGDSDGFGNGSGQQFCTNPGTGWASVGGDCADGDNTVYPGATELCDGKDNNCDGSADEGCGFKISYRDADGDGFGDLNNSTLSSAPLIPFGYVENSTDCDDYNSDVHPGAVEVCDGIDNNCDGQRDEGCPRTWYRDVDGDGYGKPNLSKQSVTKPAGYVANPDDCNDNSAAIHPNAPELPDGYDNDCDGTIDEGLSCPTWYRDADGDGFGKPNESRVQCTQPKNFVNNSLDCNDNSASNYPNAPELPDGYDNNCDGTIDEGLGCPTWYRDNDGDGYGKPNESRVQCTQPNNFVSNSLDCRDNQADVYPNAPELCDGKDNDCDGFIDEDCAVIISMHSAKPVSETNPSSAEIGNTELSVKVWPNPATNDLNVSLESFVPGQKVDMVMTTIDGRNVKSVALVPETRGQQVKINVRGLSSGFYVLRVQQGAMVEVKKVMVNP